MAQFLISAFADEAASDLAGQIAALKRNNLQYIEIRNVDGKCVIDYEEEEIQKIADQLHENGIRVSSLGSPIGKYNITDAFEPHFERFKKAVKTAKILGTKNIRMFSFFIPDGEDARKYTDEVLSRLNAMLDYAEAEGIQLCHENEARIFGCLAKNALYLQQQLPRMKAIFDPCNYIMENEDIPWGIDRIAPYVEYLHIKDGTYEDHAIVPAGHGDGKIAYVLKQAAVARKDQDTFVTVEPHLFKFVGYSNLDNRTLKHHFKFADTNESFDAAVNALKAILSQIGFKENNIEGDVKWKMEKVKFGIIGAGNMGSGHFRHFMANRVINGECVAIADLKPEKLENIKKIAEEQNPEAGKKVQYFASGDELIESGVCDAVIIAVPHYFHPTFAIKAMQHGMNALVEKPAGVYTLQVEEMLEESKKHEDLKLGIMFNQRTNPCFKKMKELIANGELGKVTRLNWIITDWYRTQNYYDGGGWRATWKGEGGGVLYNQAPHNIDLFQWIPDMMPNKVRAFCKFGKYHNIEVEDDVTAYFEYPNGATGVFITTTGDNPGTNRFEVTGEMGKLVYEGGKLTFIKNAISTTEHIRTATTGFGRPEMQEVALEISEENPQHVGILNNFANAILGLEPLYAPASDGIKGVTLANAMLMSTWTDSEIQLPIDGKKFYDLLQEHIRDSKVVKDETAGSAAADLSNTYNNK